MRCLRLLFGSSSSKWPLHALNSPLHSYQVVQAALLISSAFRNTASSAAAADQPAGSTAPPGQQNQSSLTEEQLAGLFDEELQRRLEAVACHAAQARAQPVPHPAGEHQPGSSSSSSSSSTGSGSTSLLPPAPQQAARVFQQHAAPAVWHPLLSADPWAPLPTPAHARQRLPQQLLQLLRQAGVTQEAAADALAQASSSSSSGDLESSSNSSCGGAADPQELVQEGDSSRAARVRRLFNLPGSQHQQQQQTQEGSGQGLVYSTLNRIQMKHLVQLLDECQAPSFGSKQVLLRRLVLLLRERHQRQQQQQQQQQQDSQDTHTDAYTDAYTDASTPQLWEQQQQHSAQYLQGPRQQQQQQQQAQDEVGGVSSRQLPEVAEQQRLLRAVLDVQQVGGWLLEARAQDVCIIDVRGRAGLQTHLVIATGLNQRHTRALADAIAWQLQQAALARVEQQQQQPAVDRQGISQEEAIQQPLPPQQQQQMDKEEGDASGQSGQQQQQELVEAVLTLAQQQPGSSEDHSSSSNSSGANRRTSTTSSSGQRYGRQLLPPLNVVGDASSDWCLLDAGTVTVHVLTERARRFYALEGLWGGPQGRFIRWLRSHQPRLETKDTIGRPGAPAVP